MRVIILNSIVYELTEKLSFKQRLKRGERVSHTDISKKNNPGKRKNKF